jgi:hypothetical protein
MREEGAFIFITYLFERKPHDKTGNMRRSGSRAYNKKCMKVMNRQMGDQ